MPWIRSMSCASCCVIALLGCTRDNPAFGEGTDELADTGETSTGASDSTDTGTIAECEFDEGKDLVINLPYLCPLDENTMRYERSFIVTEVASDGWLGRLCPIGDLSCASGDACEGNPPLKVQVGPFDVTGLAAPDECLTIKADRADLEATNCSFDAIGIWKNGIPIVIASNGGALIGEALADAGNLVVTPKHVEDPPCECVEACCDAAGLGDFGFDVAGEAVPVGVTTLNSAPYDFHGLAAVNPTGCADDLEFVWAMTHHP